MGFTFGSSVGQIIGGSPKTQPIYYSKDIKRGIPSYMEFLKGFRDQDVTSLADYAAEIKRLKPQAEQFAQEDAKNLSFLIGKNLAYDPLDAYERIRSGNLGALDTQAANLAGYGAAADKINLAGRGYGGRGPGSYERILTQDRVSKNIVPVLNTIFGNLGRDTGGAASDRLNNLISTFQLMQQRAERPLSFADMMLNPVRARGEAAGINLSNFGNLASTARENVAGFKQVKSPWQIAGEAGDSLMDAYMSMYGGGMMGGMGGGGGGGASASPMIGGGGGGIDMNQIMQMMKMFNQGSSGSSFQGGQYGGGSSYG